VTIDSLALSHAQAREEGRLLGLEQAADLHAALLKLQGVAMRAEAILHSSFGIDRLKEQMLDAIESAHQVLSKVKP